MFLESNPGHLFDHLNPTAPLRIDLLTNYAPTTTPCVPFAVRAFTSVSTSIIPDWLNLEGQNLMVRIIMVCVRSIMV